MLLFLLLTLLLLLRRCWCCCCFRWCCYCCWYCCFSDNFLSPEKMTKIEMTNIEKGSLLSLHCRGYFCYFVSFFLSGIFCFAVSVFAECWQSYFCFDFFFQVCAWWAYVDKKYEFNTFLKQSQSNEITFGYSLKRHIVWVQGEHCSSIDL